MVAAHSVSPTSFEVEGLHSLSPYIAAVAVVGRFAIVVVRVDQY